MAFLPLTIEEQVVAMRTAWPSFVHRTSGSDAVIWRGTLKPLTRSYDGIDMIISGPEVRVTSPRLTRLPSNPEGSLPHVYNRDRDPVLCLFDPL
jgi:hypothetical protein